MVSIRRQETERLNFNLSSLISRNQNLLPLIVVTVAVFLFMSISTPGQFLTASNFQAMALNFPEFGLLATAVMLTMLTGGIDLSIVGTANVSGVIAAVIMTRGVSAGSQPSQIMLVVILAFLAQLVTGVLCGFLNGVLISKVRIPEILVTLGTMQLFTGIAKIITKGKIVEGFPNQSMFIGNGMVFGIPVPLIIFGVVALVVALMLNRTSFGFELYMLGTNPTAARFTGINNTKMLIKTYVISGFLASLAGILVISSNNSADPSYGASYLLQTIVVAVLGGINPAGGFGTMGGLVIAIICQQFLSSGFDILRIAGSSSSYAEQMTWGVLLLLVMVINYFGNKGARSR